LLEFVDEDGKVGLMNAEGVEMVKGDYAAFALLRGGYFQIVSQEGLNGVVRPDGQILVEPRFKGIYPDDLLAHFESAFKQQGIPREEVITVLTTDQGAWALLKNEELVELD
jgi:hypothetical protein